MKKISFIFIFIFLFSDLSFSRKIKGRHLEMVRGLVGEGDFEQAAIRLYSLLGRTKNKNERTRIRYSLGLALYNMGLNQASAFQFIKVAQTGNKNYLKKVLEHLSLAGDYLGDDAILNYIVNRIRISDFPKTHRNMLYYRIGESFMQGGQYSRAISYFRKVRSDYVHFLKAKYLQAYSYAKTGRTKRALRVFDIILNHTSDKEFTDSSKVAATIGKARVYYQMKSWENALSWYRQVPKDTYLWHESLYEQSWAFLRTGKLRSALSNFQSLHSPFYEDFYQPESLILRSIIYLYICQYYEIEKVLNLFNKEYRDLYRKIHRYQRQKRSLKAYNDMIRYIDEKVHPTNLPAKVINRARYESRFRKSYAYIQKLQEELDFMNSLSDQWRRSKIGAFSKRVVQTRMLNAKKSLGRWFYSYLKDLSKNLKNYFEQANIIKFEMISGKKETLKRKLLARSGEQAEVDHQKRNFYIQNGFQYWPYQGEAWLDELGNYQYLGASSCE